MRHHLTAIRLAKFKRLTISCVGETVLCASDQKGYDINFVLEGLSTDWRKQLYEEMAVKPVITAVMAHLTVESEKGSQLTKSMRVK